jgi:hypothetical protein
MRALRYESVGGPCFHLFLNNSFSLHAPNRLGYSPIYSIVDNLIISLVAHTNWRLQPKAVKQAACWKSGVERWLRQVGLGGISAKCKIGRGSDRYLGAASLQRTKGLAMARRRGARLMAA